MNIHELLPFYALDAVTDEERQFVEVQLAKDETLRLELAELREGVDVLALDVPRLEPSATVKQQLFERIEREQVMTAPPSTNQARLTPPTRNLGWRGWYEQLRTQWAMSAFGASAVLAGVLCIWAFSLLDQLQTTSTQLSDVQQQTFALQDDLQQAERELVSANEIILTLSDEIEQLSDEVTTLATANETLQQQLDERTTTLAFYRDPTLTHFEVAGTELQGEAFGLFSVDIGAMQAALWVTGLEVLDPDETYQLWYIGDDGVVSGGVFVVERDGRASVLINSAEIDPYNAIGISIEPAGGSETPSEQIVMFGSL